MDGVQGRRRENEADDGSHARPVGTTRAGPWRDLIVNDAASHAGQLRERRLVRFSLPAIARWTVLILAVACGLGFVPEYRSKKYQQ